MSTPARRTRTGCKTCRQRKLKCDETKPVCGQCRKSNRECQPSEGIAFRHAQNAGFVDKDGGEDLANFYKYRQKFNNTYFVEIPRELTFIQVTDPYAAEESSAQSSLQVNSQPHTAQYPLPPIPQHSNPQYVDVAASSLKAMIDPNLEASQDIIHKGDPLSMQSEGHIHSSGDVIETDNINETIMKALRNTDEHVKGL